MECHYDQIQFVKQNFVCRVNNLSLKLLFSRIRCYNPCRAHTLRRITPGIYCTSHPSQDLIRWSNNVCL